MEIGPYKDISIEYYDISLRLLAFVFLHIRTLQLLAIPVYKYNVFTAGCRYSDAFGFNG
jgi:hypothetical protein